MQQNIFPQTDFKMIEDYIDEQSIKFVILDYNGVLDDYWKRKVQYVEGILGPEGKAYLPDLMLEIDKQYMLDRSATIENSFIRFCVSRNISISEHQKLLLDQAMPLSLMTDTARDFLDRLKVPFVIYTSLNRDQAQRSIGIDRYSLFTGDQLEESKPSIKNLKNILAQYGYNASDSCMVGDGLFDDLMPAKLLGMHTILVTPFVDKIAHHFS